MQNNFDKERSFRDVVISALETVNKILSRELRLYKKIIVGAGSQANTVVEEEDTRASFVQSVQALGLILHPYFDKRMAEAYGDFDDFCDLFAFEFYEKYKDEIIKLEKTRAKQYSNEDSDTEETEAPEIPQNHINRIFINKKIREAKRIFKELNLLLNRQKYLATTIYGDVGSENDVVIDDEQEDSD